MGRVLIQCWGGGGNKQQQTHTGKQQKVVRDKETQQISDADPKRNESKILILLNR